MYKFEVRCQLKLGAGVVGAVVVVVDAISAAAAASQAKRFIDAKIMVVVEDTLINDDALLAAHDFEQGNL